MKSSASLKKRCFEVKRGISAYLLVVGVFCLFANCQKESTDNASLTRKPEAMELQNAVVLKVEEVSFFNSDFEGYLQSLFGEDFNELPVTSLSRLFDDFIDEKIYSHAAKKKAVSVSIEEQKQYLAKLSRESHLEQGKNPIKQEEFTVHLDRLRIEKYMTQQIKEIAVTDEEIKGYYEQHKREFLRPERVKVSQILLETEDKAIEILERVKNSNEETFRSIAREESNGVEAARGGAMGIFEMGQLPFEMEKVIFSLKTEEISPVVESAYGYHIFRLDNKYETELVSEEQAISEIKLKIMNQKIKQTLLEHLNGLKGQFKWSSFPSNLSFEYQRKSHEEM
ncbi:peptidylprolyl isomerase [Acidobacteriota bacterium]